MTPFFVAQAFSGSSDDCIIMVKPDMPQALISQMSKKGYRVIQAPIKIDQTLKIGIHTPRSTDLLSAWKQIPANSFIISEHTEYGSWDLAKLFPKKTWNLHFRSPDFPESVGTFNTQLIGLSNLGHTEDALKNFPSCKNIFQFKDRFRRSFAIDRIAGHFAYQVKNHNRPQPTMDWAKMILMFENLLRHSKTQLAYERAQYEHQLFTDKTESLKSSLATIKDPKKQLEVYRQSVLASFPVEKYVRAYDVMQTYFLQTKPGGNCVSQTMLFTTVAKNVGLKMDPNWTQGVQLFSDHIRPVLVNLKAKKVFDLVYGKMDNEIVTPVLKPEFILLQALQSLKRNYTGFATDLTTILDKNFVTSELLIHPGKMTLSEIKNALDLSDDMKANSLGNLESDTSMSQGNLEPDTSKSKGNSKHNNSVSKGNSKASNSMSKDNRANLYSDILPGIRQEFNNRTPPESAQLVFLQNSDLDAEGTLFTSLNASPDANNDVTVSENTVSEIVSHLNSIKDFVNDSDRKHIDDLARSNLKSADLNKFLNSLKITKEFYSKPKFIIDSSYNYTAFNYPFRVVDEGKYLEQKSNDPIGSLIKSTENHTRIRWWYINGKIQLRVPDTVVIVPDQETFDLLKSIPMIDFDRYLFDEELRRDEALYEYLKASHFTEKLQNPESLALLPSSKLAMWTDAFDQLYLNGIVRAKAASDSTRWCNAGYLMFFNKDLGNRLVKSLSMANDKLKENHAQFIQNFAKRNSQDQKTIVNLFKSLNTYVFESLVEVGQNGDTWLNGNCIDTKPLLDFDGRHSLEKLLPIRSLIVSMFTDPKIIYTPLKIEPLKSLNFKKYGRLQPLPAGPTIKSETGQIPHSTGNGSGINIDGTTLELISEEQYQEIQKQSPQRQASRLEKLKAREIVSLQPETFARLILLADQEFLTHRMVQFMIAAHTNEGVQKEITSSGASLFPWANIPALAFLNISANTNTQKQCAYKLGYPAGTPFKDVKKALEHSKTQSILLETYFTTAQSGFFKINHPHILTHAPDWVRQNDHLVFLWELIKSQGEADLIAPYVTNFGTSGTLIKYPKWFNSLIVKMGEEAGKTNSLINTAGSKYSFESKTIMNSESILKSTMPWIHLEIFNGGWSIIRQVQASSVVDSFESSFYTDPESKEVTFLGFEFGSGQLIMAHYGENNQLHKSILLQPKDFVFRGTQNHQTLGARKVLANPNNKLPQDCNEN
jgi:hypothetical protein